MSRRVLMLALAVAVMWRPAVHATTVAPMAFADVVNQAETIFIGDVIQTRSVWETHGSARSITTRVTFDVVRVLKGTVASRTELSFAGGTIDDTSEIIVGMPVFKAGDRDVLFVSSD